MNFELPSGDTVTLLMVLEESDGLPLELGAATVTWSAQPLAGGSIVTLTEGDGLTLLGGSPVGAVEVVVPAGTITTEGGWKHELEVVDGAVSRTIVRGYIRVTATLRPGDGSPA